MSPITIYEGSDGRETSKLYRRLEEIGPIGIIAMNLFRAQKASSRAKTYTRRYKGAAYDKKNWSLSNLCSSLKTHGDCLKIPWGWREDPKEEFAPWVLYVDLPNGQVSFHSRERGYGPDYLSSWDGSGNSAGRIVAWTTKVLEDHGKAE